MVCSNICIDSATSYNCLSDHPPFCQFYSDLRFLQNSPLLIKGWSLERISRLYNQWFILYIWLKILNIFSNIIFHNSLRFSLNIFKLLTKIGLKVLYRRGKFERNSLTRRVTQSYFVKQCKVEEKCEENRQFLGTHISWTTGLISFKFGKYSCIYEGHKIYEFDRNWPSSYRDMRG